MISVVNKLVLALGLVGSAFIISTIVLAVLMVQDEIALQECIEAGAQQPVTNAPIEPTERPTQPPVIPPEPVPEPVSTFV